MADVVGFDVAAKPTADKRIDVALRHLYNRHTGEEPYPQGNVANHRQVNIDRGELLENYLEAKAFQDLNIRCLNL